MPHKKPTLLVDFDGVIHQYEGWNDGKPGDPVPGAEEWLWQMQRLYEVVIVSPRWTGFIGSFDETEKIGDWVKNRFGPELFGKIDISFEFPPHHLYISARCMPFSGTFPTTTEVVGFRPYWKRSKIQHEEVPEDIYDEVDAGYAI